MKLRRTLALALLMLAFGAAVVVMPPSQSHVHAESVSELQKNLADKEDELKQLKEDEKKTRAEQSKNTEAQMTARNASDADEVARLKTIGFEIGVRLNTFADKTSATEDEIAALKGKIRAAARAEVRAAVLAAKGDVIAEKLAAAKTSLASWAKTFGTFSMAIHTQENLPQRADTESKKRARREKSRLERIIKLHAAEEKLLKDESATLKELSGKDITDPAWKALKASLGELLAEVTKRAEAISERLAEDRERIRVLDKHLK